ncbi:hypothetical protein AVEN_33992-1 [Araneus ventricosus]|uniref:Uncharacterized protein n=1 Tax=Araneus ventricosus TaxID=182803 RepID=A0A4Y2E574_ARAVE|nr:hypothetical protein AVEN_33992-1 [Araneus ventricosus]
MVDTFKTEENYEPLKRARVDLDVVHQKDSDFISTNTMRSFSISNLPSEFLQKDRREYKENDSYKKSKALFSSLRVVNNVVELWSDTDGIVQQISYKRRRANAVLVAVSKAIYKQMY